ncbi:DUF2336 domain-containing protein [Polycladidibacter hongkongensis]|uniref:DUF2336 domain-containing protein n=1 Tax=Polycladidibacter hongkongensis TaxID=1647556 RepID=UPI000832DEFE|nr:DUF2336 domain-containing protein [Pseudovibrio hongkongensis]
MIIRQFFSWIKGAPEGSRKDAAGALARAYLYSDLGEEELEEAEAALTFLLDDSSTPVRAALAEELAQGQGVARHLLSSMITDVPQVALPVLQHSKDIDESDLIDLVATCLPEKAMAVAWRCNLGAGVAAALAEVGDAQACLALMENKSAVLVAASFERLAERFGTNDEVCAAMLARTDVPVSVRHVVLRGYVERLRLHPSVSTGDVGRCADALVVDAKDKATISLAWEASEDDMQRLVEHLVISGEMTTLLLLRASVCGCHGLVEAAVQKLSHVAGKRVQQILRRPGSLAAGALMKKCGLPKRVIRLLQRALEFWCEAEELDLPHWEKARLVVNELVALRVELEIAELGDLEDLLLRLSDDISRSCAKLRVSKMLEAA